MEYKKIRHAIFISRPNRFVAYVLLDGAEEKVHVKNTGRCRELLVSGCRVVLEESENLHRKTRYSVIAVFKGDLLINMDSQAPNAAAYEALNNGYIKEIGKVDYIKREVKYSESRFDLYYEKAGKKGFIEIKGVTLEQDGTAMFPDAPTERGTRHIRELIKAKKEGYEAGILFVIQFKGAKVFTPNSATDIKFSQALAAAARSGVGIMAYEGGVRR